VIKLFAAHPTAANLLMILFLALGIAALPDLEKETFPDFADLEVVVTVPYPGATAAEVEEAICRRIEDAVDGISFIDEVIAEARENLARVTVTMVKGADFQGFMGDVKTEVEAIDDFPDLAETPVISSRGDKQQVVSIAVSGEMPVTELKDYSEDLKDRLQRLDEVSLVRLQGFSERQIRIEVPAERLAGLGLSPASLASRIANQSLNLPAGALETEAGTLVVRLEEERRNPSGFESLVVAAGPSGAEVRLGEIAEITERFETDETKIELSGRRAAMLVIEKTADQDALEVHDAVSDFLAGERKRVPGIELELTRDLTSITRDRLEMLAKNAWQGLLLVFFTLWLFFSIRMAFWVTMGLPVSFLGAFFLFPILGVSVNMITMVGLLLALGLLMDDAIVIAENVATHIKRGENVLQSVAAGVGEVKYGVLSSFLTTVAVFGPITMLDGNIGQILRVMPVVLILVLAVSLVEAFLILPNHLSHSLGHGKQHASRFRVWFDDRLDRFRERVLGRIVDWAVAHHAFTVALTIAVFLISLAMLAGGVLKFQAFPSIDGDVIEARLQMPQGTPLARTERLVDRIEAAIREVGAEMADRQPEGMDLIRNIITQYDTNPTTGERGAHVADISIDLLEAERREGTVDEILSRWREKVGAPTDVVSLIFTEPALGPTGYAIEIRLIGEDLDQLKAASRSLQSWLDSFVGVRDLQDDLHPGKPEVGVRVREGALSQGLSSAELARQLRGAYQGMVAREIQVGDAAYEIEVRLPPTDRDAMSDLQTFHVSLPGGESAPLETVARIVPADRGFGSIIRIDGRRTVTVRGDVDTRSANVNELIAALEREFVPRLAVDFPGIDWSVEGESAEAAETAGSLGRGFLFGLLAIFLILSFQFRGFREPLIVMAAIPASLIGVIWGHLLLGYPLTMPSMMGFVSLMGVVVNNSILLVTFIRNHLADGAAAHEALAGASRDRFRAILLTTLTTVAGLLPLLAEQSLQAQILIPLAISLIFGLLTSTVLVLIVIPCLFMTTGLVHRQADLATQPNQQNQ